MLQTTIGELRRKAIDTSGCSLYLVKDHEDGVLYVGQSKNVPRRLQNHVANRGNATGSTLGQAIYEKRPQSDNWPVTLYALEDCSKLIEKYFSQVPIAEGEALRHAEDALMHEYNPLYNRVANNGFSRQEEASGFLERRARERQEERTQFEQEQAERRAYLVNSVCDICGERDTSVDYRGEKAGLLENSHGFRLICRKCADLVNAMRKVKENEERVHKIEKALANTYAHASPGDSSARYLPKF